MIPGLQGKDSTRKIQRAIAAGETRKLLPQLVAELSNALETFRDSCGRLFLYDGKDYQVRNFVLLQCSFIRWRR